MGKIKAILFDMDGVLIDAKEWHYNALNKALKIFGYEIKRHEHLESYDGLPTRVKLKMLTKEKNLPEELHAFINEMKQKYTMDMAYNYCKPTFAHEFALSRLKNDEYKLAVCSNAVRKSVEIMLEKANIKGYFDEIISNQDVKNSKPHPEMYLTAQKKLHVSPEESLILEDNENGIKAAKASGGHLLIIKSVNDVNYTNIKRRIEEIENLLEIETNSNKADQEQTYVIKGVT